MLWRKVMESPGQWISSQGQGSGSAVLGEMLAQEVLDSFNTLTTTSQTMLSGGWPTQESSGARDSPRAPGPTHSECGDRVVDAGTLTAESIVHESLHPLCSPLSYGGHVKVDPSCHGMVVKLDSRSRTSSDLLRLQFFSSEDDMLNEREPVRVMYGHVPERATRAKAKGMEFFKIEEADRTSYDSSSSMASSSPKDTPPSSSSGLTRLTPSPSPPPPPPPPLSSSMPPERASRVGPSMPLESSGSSLAPGLASRAMNVSMAMTVTKAMLEAPSQVAGRRKTQQAKETCTAAGLANSFRSFSLPGVRELWFRFDAPPGAEKPPLQIVSLAGALEQPHPGTVQPSGNGTAVGTPLSTPYSPYSHNHDQGAGEGEGKGEGEGEGEDLSQEEQGLQALLTCLTDGRSHQASLAAETSGKDRKRTDLDDDPDFGKPRRQTSAVLPLPGCLATTADLALTGGKWFYEATVEFLDSSATDGEDADYGLVRIGWRHADLPASLRGGDAEAKEAVEGSLVDDPAPPPTPREAEAEQEGGSQNVQGEPRSAGKVKAGPLMRTVSWLSESADSSSSVQEDALQPTDTCPTGEDEDTAWPNTGASASASAIASATESSSVLTEADAADDDKERSRIEMEAKLRQRVEFPVLGSDATNLGVGLGQKGYAWLGGRPRVRQAQGFAASDVVGCALDIDSGTAWFSVNGLWAGGDFDARESAVLLRKLGWGDDRGVGNGVGVSPCLSVRGKSSVSVNFGAEPFKYPPPGQEFLPVILRDVPDTEQEVAGERITRRWWP